MSRTGGSLWRRSIFAGTVNEDSPRAIIWRRRSTESSSALSYDQSVTLSVRFTYPIQESLNPHAGIVNLEMSREFNKRLPVKKKHLFRRCWWWKSKSKKTTSMSDRKFFCALLRTISDAVRPVLNMRKRLPRRRAHRSRPQRREHGRTSKCQRGDSSDSTAECVYGGMLQDGGSIEEIPEDHWRQINSTSSVIREESEYNRGL